MSDWTERGFQRRVLVDSAAYFATAETREVNHSVARTIAQGLREQRWRVYTTNFVIAEAHALILARQGRDVAARFLFDIEQSRGTAIVRASAADEHRARWIIDRYDDKDFSLTDAISFAVMERLGIPFAFTFDHHFTQYGWTVLTPDHF